MFMGKQEAYRRFYQSSNSFLQFERKCGCLKHDMRQITKQSQMPSLPVDWSVVSPCSLAFAKKKSSSRLLTGTRRQIRIFSTADIPAFASLLIFLNVLALYFQPFNCVMLSLVVPRTALQQKGYTAFQINRFGQYKRPSLSYFNHILKTDFFFKSSSLFQPFICTF